MSNLSDKELVDLSAKGVLAGPEETEESFVNRASNIFSVEVSNKGLMPWQGGCTLIDEKGVTIQLRKGKGKIWGLYSREEIVAHEKIHVMRARFEEPRFEEILAYQTSESSFRKYFGPLFRTPTESLFLLTLLALFSIVNLLYSLPWWTLFLSVGSVLFFFFRLARDQRIFAKTYSNVKNLLGCEKKAQGFLLHLTDREIISFSKCKSEEIWRYGKSQSCLRWRQILAEFAS